MGRLFRVVTHVLQGLFIAFIVIGIFVFAAGKLGLINPLSAYIILSGSMEPTIPVGSIVLVEKNLRYNVGDVISYTAGGDAKNVVTHRIASMKDGETYFGDATYITKGDANKAEDQSEVSQSSVLGTTILTVPYIGYPAHFAKTPQGFILLIIIPATIIVYEEIKVLLREILSVLKRLFGKIRYSLPRLSFPVRSLRILLISIPVVAALTYGAVASVSFFQDTEASPDNVFSASETYATPGPSPTSTPTPTPTPAIAQTLVINEVLPDTSCTVGQNKEAQWLEVYNGYNVTVNLKDFEITDGVNTIDLVTANTNLGPGLFALLAHDNAIWQQNGCYDDNNALTTNLGGGTFDIDTSLLQLIDPSQVIVDTVQWGGATGLNPTQNQSIERNPDGFDTALGSSFNASDFVVRPTPFPGL